MLSGTNDKNGLKILIVGAGKVGTILVEQLALEGHDITIVDIDSAKISMLTNVYDAMGIVGNGASYSTLLEAGIEKADLIIAVTGSDELNLLCCVVAKRAAKVSAIARVRTPDYGREVDYFCEKLGLAMIINPDFEAARLIARSLSIPTALEVMSFAHGKVDMVKVGVPEGISLCNESIASLGKAKIIEKIVICAVVRDGEIIIPDGKFVIKAGDVLSFAAAPRDARAFLKKVGYNTSQVKDSLIVGGGRAGYYLAKQLIKSGISVRLIEVDEKRCNELSELLPEATIIHGDGTSEDLLKEEGLETVDAFIPMVGIDEENVLAALHAKQVSDARVVTRITRNNYKAVVDGLDLGSVVYPKYITSEAIIAYVRAKKNSMNCDIETLYYMFEQKAEAIEFKIESAPGVVDIPLSELKLKQNLLIAFIYRKGKAIIPKGQDCIKTGDTVMIVTSHKGFHDIQDILV